MDLHINQPKSIPVTESILYEQRNYFIDSPSKSRYGSVTLSNIKSEHKKGGELTWHHGQGKRINKSLRCHRSPKVLSQEQTSLVM